MALLLVLPGRNVEKLKSLIQAQAPDVDVRLWPDADPEGVDMAVTWNHPPGELGKYPGLKAVMSYGAGVDHLLRDPELPPGLPVARVVDPSLVRDLVEYLMAVVLARKRLLLEYHKTQACGIWKPVRYKKQPVVGLLGLGQIGRAAAETFSRLRFVVKGWSRTPKGIPGVSVFYGSDQLHAMVSDVDVLICLLPLTSATENILNRELFQLIQPGAFLINAGRGAHLNEADLLEALDSGQLSGACLDVFRTEPLQPDHPFWTHPNIQVTPHIAAITDAGAVVSQIVENYRRLKKGESLNHLINRENGY